MKPVRAPQPPEAARFRLRLFATIIVVVASFAAVTLFVARRSIAANEEAAFEREFQSAIATLDHVQQLRHAILVERCRALARKPRLQAALEDGALDLLYLSARDELRDVIHVADEVEHAGSALRAQFYRFLDDRGQVLSPPENDDACGSLSADEEVRINLPGLNAHPETGFIVGTSTAGELTEIITTPIFSSETGEPIAALVLGFSPNELAQPGGSTAGFTSGVRSAGALHMPSLAPTARADLQSMIEQEIRAEPGRELAGRFQCALAGAPYLAFFKHLNPDSRYPPGYELCVFPLAAMQARQRRVTWQILGAGGVLLLLALPTSRLLAGRFSKPVAQLAHDSHEQRVHRQRAEAALETTSAELERVARFSADASHQLKTPVTVLRAGLEEILARGALPPPEIEEVSTLIHQTYRLSTIIEDLLLLSRMDAGQLKIHFGDVDLARLIDASLDDLSASPDALDLAVDSEFVRPLPVAGEKRYIALILQNLLENARKYNRPGGRIHVAAHSANGSTRVTIGNTTRRPIPPEAKEHIFERFHRGTMGENIPGYGIGLNLARELARLHDGELRLLRSDESWTEFEVTFRTRDPHAPEAS